MDILLALIEATTFNWMAMLVALVATYLIGFIWYSKPVFGTTWMQGIGLDEAKAREAGMAKAMGWTAIAMSIFIVVLSIFCAGAGLQQGIVMGLLLGVGVLAPAHIVNGLFAQTPSQVIWINVGHDIVLCLVLGAIIGAW